MAGEILTAERRATSGHLYSRQDVRASKGQVRAEGGLRCVEEEAAEGSWRQTADLWRLLRVWECWSWIAKETGLHHGRRSCEAGVATLTAEQVVSWIGLVALSEMGREKGAASQQQM